MSWFEHLILLEKTYGETNKDWRVLKQTLASGNENGKKTYFDILKVELADKTIKELEFELIDGIGEIKDKDRAKLLIFEDDPAILDIYKEVFGSNNFEVKTYDTYKDVVDVVARENPDIIYCDIIMPDMNGWDAIKLLKKDERTKYIPVIIVDNQYGKKEVKQGYKAGAVFHCCKTEYTPKQLIDIFKEFLSYKSKWERYTDGHILNSLRNKEMVNKLNERYKKLGLSASEILDIGYSVLGKSEYLEFSLYALFDPRSPNWFATSKEGAIEGMKRGAYTDELDRKYKEEKSKNKQK